jgi:hypothetical protein
LLDVRGVGFVSGRAHTAAFHRPTTLPRLQTFRARLAIIAVYEPIKAGTARVATARCLHCIERRFCHEAALRCDALGVVHRFVLACTALAWWRWWRTGGGGNARLDTLDMLGARAKVKVPAIMNACAGVVHGEAFMMFRGEVKIRDPRALHQGNPIGCIVLRGLPCLVLIPIPAHCVHDWRSGSNATRTHAIESSVQYAAAYERSDCPSPYSAAKTLAQSQLLRTSPNECAAQTAKGQKATQASENRRK